MMPPIRGFFDVNRHSHATPSRRILYCRSRFLQFLGCAAGDDNVGTVTCKEPRRGGANAGSSTSNDSDSTGEVVRIQVHKSTSLTTKSGQRKSLSDILRPLTTELRQVQLCSTQEMRPLQYSPSINRHDNPRDIQRSR
jgi:hypothetical protein